MSKVTLSQSCILFLCIISLAIPSVVYSGGTECTVSFGCASDVQTSSGGFCTDISNCKDTINRTSSLNSTACYVDPACSNANPGELSVRDAGSGSCVNLAYCDELKACQNAALGGTCGGGSTECTVSFGCASDVQTSSGGFCTDISNCKDTINRTSSLNSTACYVDPACSNANPGELSVRDAGSGSCVNLAYCDELKACQDAALGGTCGTPSDVSGCFNRKGSPGTNRKVILRQSLESDQITYTDSEGCYSFDSANRNKPFKIIIQGIWK